MLVIKTGLKGNSCDVSNVSVCIDCIAHNLWCVSDYLPSFPDSSAQAVLRNANIEVVQACSRADEPGSLVPRPFPLPVFDRILYAKTEGEGLGERVTCATSGRREAVVSCPDPTLSRGKGSGDH